MLQKAMSTESAIGCLVFIHQVLLFCPTHAHIIRSSMGVASSICSEAGRLDFSANKSNRPASEQILPAMPTDERMMCACVGQNKRWKMWYRQKNLTYLGLTGSWSSNRIFDRPINGWEISDSVFGQTRCTRLYVCVQKIRRWKWEWMMDSSS